MLFQDVTPVGALLYVGVNPEGMDVESSEAAAKALGLEVFFTVSGDDPDGSQLREAILGAKAGGEVKAIVVPTLESFGAKSLEDFRARLTHILSEGFRFVVLEPRRAHQKAEDIVAELDDWLGVSHGGKSRGTKRWVEKRRDAGEHIGRSPRCGKCGHGVTKRGGGKGHLRTEGVIGPCFVAGCGCTRYEARNERMMGKSSS